MLLVCAVSASGIVNITHLARWNQPLYRNTPDPDSNPQSAHSANKTHSRQPRIDLKCQSDTNDGRKNSIRTIVSTIMRCSHPTCQLFSGWSRSLIIVKPDTVVSWHRKGWKANWRWRSRRSSRTGRRKIEPELRELIRRMARDNCLWGQRRIQAELARLGFEVCPRTVARYMRRPYSGSPSPGWRQFLTQHSADIWACDLFTVQTVWFQTLYVFFVIHHGTRELVRARVTAQPNSQWLAQ